MAGFLRRRIWVRAQRKPEKKAAEITRMNPRGLKAVSPAAVMTTPTMIIVIMRINLTETASRRKRKANKRTKAREEDLHMARAMLAYFVGCYLVFQAKMYCKM